MDEKVYILKEDFVIPRGARFVKGPNKREYGGGNYETTMSISKDETADFTIYDGPDTMNLFAGDDENA